MRDIACHDSPRPHVQKYSKLRNVEKHQSWTEEHPHPYHTLIVDQMQNVFGYFEVAILRKSFFQVPAPIIVDISHEQSSEEIDSKNRNDS